MITTVSITKIVLRLIAFVTVIFGLAVEFGFITETISKIIIFLIAVVSIVGDAVLSLFRKILMKNQRAQSMITKSLDLACMKMYELANAYGFDLENDGQIRANVFLPKRATSLKLWLAELKLRVAFHSSNMKGASDLGIKFDKWQGCTGKAWGLEKVTVSDLTLPEVEGGAAWGLDEHQLSITSKIKTIISVPIFHPLNEKVVGIFSIDSEKPLFDFFNSEDVEIYAGAKAGEIGALLQTCGLLDPLDGFS